MRSLSPCFLLGALLLLIAWSAGAEPTHLILQSTTSTQNSGLLAAILPGFTDKTGIEVRVVAVGTGQALKNGRNGDGDVLLVHARAGEDEFIAGGHGIDRRDVMFNDFVIVGPKSDPAGVRGTKDVGTALQKIAEAASAFASRGDDSGTHTKERSLWSAAKIEPQDSSGQWYLETGSGMGATLNTAVGMQAYTLTDRGTWISFKNRGDFEVLVEGDTRLFNPYGVMIVNPERHPHVKVAEARQLLDWLTGADGQAAIAAYRLNGEPLFFPSATR